MLRILKIKSYGGKNIFMLAGGNHIRTVKSVIGSIDFYSVSFIKGSSLVDEKLYNQFYLLVKNKTIKIPIDPYKIIIRAELILEIINKFTNQASDELDRVDKLRIAITNIMADS